MTTTPSSSGRHRSQAPSPDRGDLPGLHPARPLLTVVRGEPTLEELAALTVVLAGLSQRRPRRRPTPIGAWSCYAEGHRRPVRPGPGGWRASGRSA